MNIVSQPLANDGFPLYEPLPVVADPAVQRELAWTLSVSRHHRMPTEASTGYVPTPEQALMFQHAMRMRRQRFNERAHRAIDGAEEMP